MSLIFTKAGSILVLILLTAGCRSHDIVILKSDDFDVSSIVTNYVQQKYAWTQDQYQIKIKNDFVSEGRLLVFVLHIDDRNPEMSGESKSFMLYADKKTGRIMHELGERLTAGSGSRAIVVSESDGLDIPSIVTNYVQQKYAWTQDQYQIKIQNDVEGRLLVFVTHIDDLDPEISGENKSFALDVDKKTGRIIRELGVQ